MNDKNKILIADDDPEIREVVRILLESEGFTVLEAVDGNQAVELADETCDLVILDIMMPGMSGITACSKIRKKTTAPILMLTAKSQDSDKTVGFSAGADDYLTKPFSYTELIVRVKAMLRRYYVYGSKSELEFNKVINIGCCTVDCDRSQVKINDTEIFLTDIEYRILLLLATNRKKIFSVQNIYESVWDEPYFYSSNNTVMVHIRNLRKKIGDDNSENAIIKTVWGKGYRIE
ncbi:MAG: response regulator transcription factor [Oscillospiraceae bacterium]